MSHYNAVVLITPLITHAPTEAPAPRSHSVDPCCSPLWRQHYAVPYSDTALPALDAVDLLLSPYWDGYDVPNPPGFPRCIGYDFYRIGGRWHGQFLPGYDPERDPRNQEPCPHCRMAAITDSDAGQCPPRPIPTLACRWCEGTGQTLKSTDVWVPLEGANIARAANLPEGLSPYAIVTPDGAWHEREGHFYQPLSEPEASEWVARVRQILEDNRDAVAVNLDCHV